MSTRENIYKFVNNSIKISLYNDSFMMKMLSVSHISTMLHKFELWYVNFSTDVYLSNM